MRFFTQDGRQVAGGDAIDTPRGPAVISDWSEHPPRVYVRLKADNEYVGFSPTADLKLKVRQ